MSLDGIIGCGRTSFETVIMLFTALKKNIMSRYSCQYVIGSKSKEISLSTFLRTRMYGNFKVNFVARRWMRSVLVIKSIDCGDQT